MPAGEHRLTASRAGNLLRPPGASDDEPAERKVKVGGVATIDLVVDGPAGRISGVVRDEGGAIVADAFVEATAGSRSG